MTRLLMIITAVFFIFFCTGCCRAINTLLGVAATGYGIYKAIDK